MQFLVTLHQLIHLVYREDFDHTLMYESHIDNSFLLHHECVVVDDTSSEQSFNDELSLIKDHVHLDDTLLQEIQILDNLILLLQDFPILLPLSTERVYHIIQEWLVTFGKILQVWHL